MTSYISRTLKRAVAVAVSCSLFISASALPAAAQSFRAGAAAESGTAVRPVVAPLGGSLVPSVTNGLNPALGLSPALSAASAPSAVPSAAAVPSALRSSILPAASEPAKKDETPAPSAKPALKPVPATEKKGENEGDGGPRWVEEPGAPAKTVADGGPRWVGPIKGLVARFLPFLSKPSSNDFDGAKTRKNGVEDTPVAAKGSETRPSGLGRSSRTSVIQDISVPTPKAVEKVAALDKARADAGPRWVGPLKAIVPLAIVGAAALLSPAALVPAAIISGSLMFSILAHETAHILGLRIWGDKTPKLAGRDSLNPFKHVSMVGTVLVPAATLIASMATIGFPILFGWAKPVPVDFNNLKNPKTDAAKVAILGPLTNLALAAVAGLVYLAFPAAGIASTIALTLFKMNVALTIFNLLPLPQLDGGKVLVSLLPKSWYAKWTHDPKLPNGYQAIYKRIYEGPANLLSKLHVHSFEHVNTMTRVASLAALGVFYAAFFNVLAVPLLFLALPCSYDYWCIREKVRSEAAVQDLMEIMSQWSAVIVQISEDLGLDSEVSAYETEHAMKNALETLVDELMAKEEFRALTDEQKLEELMKAYPDKAAEFLKEKAMTEDSLEKIKAVLADPRNAPFYERLKKWFGEHEIFARWDNDHHKGKLKDAMKEAGKDKAQGAGSIGHGTHGGRLLSALSRLLSAPVIGDDDAPADAFPWNKVTSWDGRSVSAISVQLAPNADSSDVARVLQGLDYRPINEATRYYEVVIANRTDGALIARRLARDQTVETVTVNPALREQMNFPSAEPVRTPEADPFAPVAWTDKVKLNNGYPLKRVRVIFHNQGAARKAFREFSGQKEMKGSMAVEFSARTPADAAEMAREFAGQIAVKNVTVGSTVYQQLLPSQNRATPPDAVEPPATREEETEQRDLPLEQADGTNASAPEETPAPQPEPLDENWQAKVQREDGLDWNVRVSFDPSLDADKVRESLVGYGAREKIGDYDWKISVSEAGRRAEVAKELAQRRGVTSVGVSKEIKRTLLGAPPMPEKVSSHGKAEYGVNVVLVKFAAGTEDSVVRDVMARHGAPTLYHHGDMVTLSAKDDAEASAKAVALAAEEAVQLVKVHPNVASAYTDDDLPYSGAPAYDHSRALIVDFREGVSEEAIAEYAELRRLTLVHPKFRGAERSALVTVPAGADLDATLQMLVDETAAQHSAAGSVRPFQEQPGKDAVVASEAAIAAAKTEEKAPEAAVIPRRDPAQAWVEYLQNVTLSDGKSKLTDKQIQLIAYYLKPIAKSPEDTRPPVVARTEEIKRALPIVTSPRGMRNSIILVGEAGVGKTAIAEGLAEMAEQAEHAALTGESSHLDFARLKGRWLVEMDINEVLASEDPVKTLSAILKLLPLLNEKDPSEGNKVIVLMDEIQKFFLDPAGTKIANILKNPLRNGELSVIAGTTSKEYKAYIEKDDAFRRRLEKIDVEEFTVEKTIRVLRAMKTWFQGRHKASIPDQALVDAAKLTDQFDKTNFNPDKAIKAVQDAAELSRPETLRGEIALDISETWGELVVAFNEARQLLLDKGIASTVALPAEHWNKIAELADRAAKLYAERDAVESGVGKVTTEVVKRVIAQKTGIASGQLNLGEEDAARYNAMEEEVSKRVVNQEPALKAIANAIRRNKAGLSNPNRPMGKFLLTGPTGVGKTYLAKELARFLFNDPTAMIRFDMSEFMEEHAAMRLVGAPPSYVGYGEGGQLTEAVRKKPYSVILFDEVEKAHPKVFDMLLQILDDGRLTDGEGRTVDFKNTVIIMTSNAGMSGVDGEKYAKLLAKIEAHNAAVKAGKSVEVEGKALPTAEEVEAAWDAEIDLMVAESLKTKFRPEFLNRLDEDPRSKNKWIRVNRLRQQDVRKIAKIQLEEFQHLLADRHDTEFAWDESLIEFLTVEGFSPLYGARPMTAAIEKHIIDPLAQWILKEAAEGRKDARGGRIHVKAEDGKIVFMAAPKPAKNVQKMSIQGAAESVAAETFALLESLVGEGRGEEPSESVFDAMLRRAAPKKSAGETEAKAERKQAFFNPGAGIDARGTAVVAEHNNAKKKDAAMRKAIADAREAAAAQGWAPEIVDLLDAPAGQVGEGWLKQLVRLSKEHAARDGAAPIGVTAEIGKDAIRIAVSGAHRLTADDQKSLLMHFTGAAPESYLAAQQKADNLNLSARLLWDHNLLDLYRRLSAIPGARMGYETGSAGTTIWVEIRKEQPKALVEAAAKASAPSTDEGGRGTPHQRREMKAAQDLFMKFVDQSRLKESDRDGHAIRIAAAVAWTQLAQPSDAALAREWIKANGWDADVEVVPPASQYGSATVKKSISSEWPLAMTAALVLEKFGGAEDALLLENVSRRITGTSHYEVPVHQALTQALSAIYARLGLAATRAAMSRAAQIKGGHTADITGAAKRALGSVGMPIDADEAKNDPDGWLALQKRLGKTSELLRVYKDTTFWGMASDPVKQAALRLAGETETGDDALRMLKNHMKTQTSYSRTGFEASYAWAAVAARMKLTRGLGGAIKRYLDEKGLSEYSSATAWTTLLAYVELARLAGGAEVLGALEEMMDHSPSDITPVHEQPYFSTPDAWARSLLRSGKFDEYAKPQGLDEKGSPKPSKLQVMLLDKNRPMKVAAALRAIAYARDAGFKRDAIEPAGDVPNIHPEGSSSSSSPRGPSNPRFDPDRNYGGGYGYGFH